MKFAKIFDTPSGQFLAFMDTVDDAPVIVFKGEAYKGVLPSVTIGGWNDDDDEAEQQRQFEGIDQAKAEATAAQLRKAVANLMDPKA